MRSLGFRANAASYCADISACEKGRQWQLAHGLFEGMSEQGLQANVITYDASGPLRGQYPGLPINALSRFP